MTSMEAPPMTETGTGDQNEIAQILGIPPERLTRSVLIKIAEDPLYLHHIEMCRTDPAMLDLLLGSETQPAALEISNRELLSRVSSAMTRWAASGFGKVPEVVYRSRMTACQGCEHLTTPPKKGFYQLIGSTKQKSTCGLCGCDVRRKAWLPTESCPDGRWTTEE
ncbi:hypothetical protein OG426_54595 (plasmid) [Streptomyces canus]|uniref:hypothetical protein n=1 Tax=Streptomyces canus TaxID=58343 RepID=UPI002F916601|nr:hypothetical protein OG426_54595 [Streptomyces canus]